MRSTGSPGKFSISLARMAISVNKGSSRTPKARTAACQSRNETDDFSLPRFRRNPTSKKTIEGTTRSIAARAASHARRAFLPSLCDPSSQSAVCVSSRRVIELPVDAAPLAIQLFLVILEVRTDDVADDLE